MSKRQRFEMQATEIGRRRVQSLDFAMMISEMLKEGASPDDLFFRTAVLMCTDENDQIQMTPRALTRFINGHLPEIKEQIIQATKRLHPELADFWQSELTRKKPSRSEGPRELSQDEVGQLIVAMVPLLENRRGQWKDKNEDCKPFEDDNMSPEDSLIFKEVLTEASQQVNLPVDSVLSLFQRVSNVKFPVQ
jgi:hypothetical protein